MTANRSGLPWTRSTTSTICFIENAGAFGLFAIATWNDASAFDLAKFVSMMNVCLKLWCPSH